MNYDIIAKILKYIDDSKVIAKVSCEDDVDKVQNILSIVYQWEKDNNMLWNSDKFMSLKIGNESIRNNTTYFTPNYDELIDTMAEAKDLGIMFDYNFNFKCQMRKVIKKANNKIS